MKTKDYGMFKFRNDNRDKISKSHVEHLVRSIGSRNLLELKPILVNKDMEIIDGQHRFLAAQQLGVDVYYNIEPGVQVCDVILMNTAKAWGNGDYLNYYVVNGNEEYINLKNFMERNSLSLTVALSLTTTQGKDDMFDFKFGKYKFVCDSFSDELAICWETINYIKRMNGASAYTGTGRFWRALLALIKHPNFIAHKWKNNLERLVSKIGPKVNTYEYQATLAYIYNWKNTQRISFRNDAYEDGRE